MQFVVNREVFNAAINQVIGGVEKRQTMQILSNLLLDVREGQLILVATDHEIQLRTSLEVTVVKAGAITVNARKLADIIKAAPPEADISLRQSDGWIDIDIGTGTFRLATIEADSFPQMAIDSAHQSTMTLSEKNLYTLIEKTQFSMAQQDVRYFLNGLLLEVNDTEIIAVATDGHRLAYAQLVHDSAGHENRQVIVPRKMIGEILKALNKDSEALVNLTLRDNQIELLIGVNSLISKLIDGKYPDYSRVIPSSNSKTMIAPKSDLKLVLQRASILSNERFAGAYFYLMHNQLVIESNNSEHESSKESMAVQYEFDELKISFNISYLLNILAVIDSERVRMDLEAPDSSVLITPEIAGNVHVKYVLMPMKL
ncbi:MAG: DNA polymerase III subunit beta [Halothiobacillus sp. 20-53-49]|nr:DNA polymerase III subunit beta [Halothiobacillaceae bacterium]OYV46591.1 MAG: DNA polymerase III subunit beta [Halothiobacillus sp. 20-53-49]HUM99035.1 DNA polymerase III subunit beta [Halothiobacillus sp.]